MSKSIESFARAFIVGLAVCSAHAQGEEKGTCSLETLHGTMVYATISKLVANGEEWSISGQESYDGKGNMKYYELLSYGGPAQTYVGTATYTVTANCIATVIYDTGVAPWTYFLSADGEHYYWNNNQNTGVISAGRADRVSRELLVQ
jgi:hypothetical protein